MKVIAINGSLRKGQRTTSRCHLAHIVIQLGGMKLAWEPDKETFPGNDAANRLVNHPPMRALEA